MFNGFRFTGKLGSLHRLHHARTDTPEECPVSSREVSVAHMRGFIRHGCSKELCPELLGPVLRMAVCASAGTVAFPILGPCTRMAGFSFWLGAIRLVYSLHMQCFVNSIRTWVIPKRETQARTSGGSVAAIGGMGENWHRNHHITPARRASVCRWWQTDIGWYVICALEAVGLQAE